MISDDTQALLRLVAAGGASEPRRRLLEQARPAHALTLDLHRHGLGDDQIAALRARPQGTLAHTLKWLSTPGHHLLGWHDPDYPPLLRRGPNPPVAVFVAGDPARLWHPGVAVVGSRSPTAGGRDNARTFAHAFAASGLAVISGLAAGVDTAAHEAALACNGLTVAVLGTGPDVPYPSQNAALLDRIKATGVVVSEHLPGTRPRKEHFPSRNRILAGLALGTLVVEAAQRSGALITARLAAEAGREVFAVPGSIHNPLARGCHRLIRDGATLVESAEQAVAALNPAAALLAQDLRQRLGDPIHPGHGIVTGHAQDAGPEGPDYQNLWHALGHDPTDMDQLVERTGLTTAALSSMLLVMELEGRVAAQHGRYSRSR